MTVTIFLVGLITHSSMIHVELDAFCSTSLTVRCFMRVLLLAENCNPDWPSLPIVGYKLCRAIGEHIDTVVATHIRNRPNIERSGMGRCSVCYFDNEYIASPMYKTASLLRGGNSVAWTTGMAMNYLPYLVFEHQVWNKFQSDLQAKKFDLVHRVIPMSPTLPSPMAKLSPQPFIIGPLNGGLKWPRGYSAELAREREYLTYFRNVFRFLPYSQSTFHRASAILAAFSHTIRDLPHTNPDRVFDIPEVGIDPDLFASPLKRTPSTPITFLYVGRLVPYKCPDVAISAFASDPLLRNHKLRIVGDGPERQRLEQMILDHNLTHCVTLVGSVNQAQVGDEMRKADVFVFPSIRELGAGVVVEAMASSLPCIVVEYGAPGELVGNERGICIPLGSKSSMTQAFGQAMLQLASSPDEIVRIGDRASEYAMRFFTWDAKAKQVLDIYDWVLGRRQDRPVVFSRNTMPSPKDCKSL